MLKTYKQFAELEILKSQLEEGLVTEEEFWLKAAELCCYAQETREE